MLPWMRAGNVNDFITVTALSTVTEDDALDLPNPSPFTSLTNAAPKPGETAPSAAWFVQTDIAYDSSDALQSGSLLHGQSSCFEAELSGTRKISFYWKVDSQENGDYLKFYIDTDASDGADNYTEMASISGDVNWARTDYLIHNSASYLLKWCYEKDSSITNSLDAGWVDEVIVSVPMSIADALDITGPSFSRAEQAAPFGSQIWFGQSAVTNNNGDALQSGEIKNNKESCFETEVTGTQRIQFYWKVDSQSNSDFLNFYVGSGFNSVKIKSISGDVDWSYVDYVSEDASGSSYPLRWCYKKDSNGSAGRDKAWIDELVISAPIDRADALDISGQSIVDSGTGNAPWFGQTEITNDGVDALQSGSVADGEKSCFETSIMGPKKVSFYWKIDTDLPSSTLAFYINNKRSGNINEHCALESGKAPHFAGKSIL